MDENNGGRATTVSRRGVLAATGTASVALVTGCSGGDDTGTDEPADDEDATGTEDGEMSTEAGEIFTDTGTPSVPGTVSSDIEELAIVAHQPDLTYFDETSTYNFDTGDQPFPVKLLIENNGDQQTDAGDYYYDLTPYDDEGNDISLATEGSVPFEGGTGTGMSPGGRGSVVAWSSVAGFPSQVARYELTLKCSVRGGVYCE